MTFSHKKMMPALTPIDNECSKQKMVVQVRQYYVAIPIHAPCMGSYPGYIISLCSIVLTCQMEMMGISCPAVKIRWDSEGKLFGTEDAVNHGAFPSSDFPYSASQHGHLLLLYLA